MITVFAASLRGAREARDEAIQCRTPGLLRCARNDAVLRTSSGNTAARPGSPSVESRLGLPNRGGGMILGTPAETGGIDELAAGAGLRAGLAGSGIGRGGRADSGGGGAVWRQPVLCVEGAFATSQDRRDHAGAAAQPCGAAFGAALRRAAGAGGRAGGRDDCGVAGLGEARAWHRGQPSGDVVGPGPTGPDAKKNGCGRPNRTAPMSPKHAPHGPS